jgi:hypothetical protein
MQSCTLAASGPGWMLSELPLSRRGSMPWRNPPNRSEEYRRRADEVRAKADLTVDDETRKTLLSDGRHLGPDGRLRG